MVLYNFSSLNTPEWFEFWRAHYSERHMQYEVQYEGNCHSRNREALEFPVLSKAGRPRRIVSEHQPRTKLDSVTTKIWNAQMTIPKHFLVESWGEKEHCQLYQFFREQTKIVESYRLSTWDTTSAKPSYTIALHTRQLLEDHRTLERPSYRLVPNLLDRTSATIPWNMKSQSRS